MAKRALQHTSTHAPRRTRAGFTFAEMLAALLVLTLVTAVVCTGVNTAMRTYTESQYAAQSELLAGNIENVLDGTLRYMKVDPTTKQGTITYHGTEIKNARLQVHSDGLLYFDGDGGTSVKLLNAGAFNRCTIDPASLGATGWLIDENTETLPDGTTVVTGYTVSGGYTIVSADGTMKKNQYFTYVPLTDISPVQPVEAAPAGD